MNITFQTVYDRKALQTMARALRKTVRKKHSCRSHVFGWLVAVIVAALIWEDRLNGYFAGKRALPGTKHTTSTFDEEGYTSTNAAGETRWNYANVYTVAETRDYFVFVLNANHAQVYQKENMTGGTAEEFRAFMEEKLGRPVEQV